MTNTRPTIATHRPAVLRNLVVDGTGYDGGFAGDAQLAPFVVFDVDQQENVAGPFDTRAAALADRDRILAGGAAVLDGVALRAYGAGAQSGTAKPAHSLAWLDPKASCAFSPSIETVGKLGGSAKAAVLFIRYDN